MADPGTTLRWTSWPLREEWPHSLLKIALLAGICALFVVVFGDLGWLATPLLVAALARWFFPAVLELGPGGISVTFFGLRTQSPWSRFRRFYPHRIGVHLSPFESPSALDPFRGLFVRFAGNREEVLRRIEAAGLRRGEVTHPESPAPPPGGPAPSRE